MTDREKKIKMVVVYINYKHQPTTKLCPLVQGREYDQVRLPISVDILSQNMPEVLAEVPVSRVCEVCKGNLTKI